MSSLARTPMLTTVASSSCILSIAVYSIYSPKGSLTATLSSVVLVGAREFGHAATSYRSLGMFVFDDPKEVARGDREVMGQEAIAALSARRSHGEAGRRVIWREQSASAQHVMSSVNDGEVVGLRTRRRCI